jgi:hypothetical protein
MAKKRTKKQNRAADRTRKSMSAAKKRDKPIKDLLKRTLGKMGQEGNGHKT